MNKLQEIIMKFNKYKYIKEITFKNDKSIKIKYYHQNKFKPNYLINNDHIFFHNGYRTILTSDTVKETLNPLNINSLYPVEKFQVAIETKVIKDVFNNLQTEKIDLIKLLLIANVLIGVALLYYQFMGVQ